MKKVIWGGLGIIALGSAAWYISNQISMSKKLCFKVVGYTIQQITAQGTLISLKLQIRNLGALEVKVKKYKLNVYAEKKYLATAFSNQETIIKPKDTIETDVLVTLNPKTLLQNVATVIAATASGGWGGITINIKGGVSISKSGIPFHLPISANVKLAQFTEGVKKERPC